MFSMKRSVKLLEKNSGKSQSKLNLEPRVSRTKRKKNKNGLNWQLLQSQLKPEEKRFANKTKICFIFDNTYQYQKHRKILKCLSKFYTEAKRCFATHDEDIDYFKDSSTLHIYKSYIFNRMRIYSTVQLCSITSLWHSDQRLCRAIGRLQVRISLGFWLFSKKRSLSS